MVITQTKFDGLNLIVVQGTLDCKKDSAIQGIILNTPPQEENHLLIDCSDLKAIIRVNNSLSGFLNYMLQLKAQGVQILLYKVDEKIKRILKLLLLDNLFEQTATLDDAYLSLSQKLMFQNTHLNEKLMTVTPEQSIKKTGTAPIA